MTRTSGERANRRQEVAGLVREVQQLTAERRRLESRRASSAELHANERELDELRWLLAEAARTAAMDEPLRAA